jgi:hypothetical protein
MAEGNRGEQRRKHDADVTPGRDGAAGDEPFRASGSGASYSPDASWAAERDRNGPSGGNAPDIAGAPSGAGDGGFGPEGDFSGAAGQGAADVLGQVHGDNSRLVEEAQERGPRRADREFTGGEGVDAPAARD